MKNRILTTLSFLLLTLLVQAQIKVASILGDNMVLQRNSEVKIWGTSEPKSKLIISASWDKLKITATSNDKGEWLVKIKTSEAGGPYSITISDSKQKIVVKNILLGEVWLCSGQSNMEMPMMGYISSPVNGANEALFNADNDNIRLYTVKPTTTTTPQDSCVGNWLVANSESASKFSAVGYFFARQLQQKLKVPVGMICASSGGSRIESWMEKADLIKFPEALLSSSKDDQDNRKPSQLYNGMIHPIQNYVIKGALWYQGESNRVNYQDYAALMGGLVEGWRNDFAIGQFPFYFVQIAPNAYDNSKDILSPKLWDEQLKASLTIPNSGMVCTVDLGEEDDIHPAEKEMVSKRLSYWAIAETYGIKGIEYKNTYFKKAVAKDETMIVSFENNIQGITSFGKEVTNFEIAGEDRIFYPAKAVFKTSKVVRLSAPEVMKPVAVRYCYHNFPQGKGFLYSTAGLPIPPFRSDNW
jgi:sialate O-acetylesterase